jgi:hypothetical protein
MLAENEIVSLLLGVGMALFFWANLERIRGLTGYRLMLWGFLSYLSAAAFTVLEGFIWAQGFNFLEHLGYLASAVFLAAWIAALTRPRQEAG